MNKKFDELTRSIAQSVTRRTALKKFGAGLAGMALACFGLPNKTEANNDLCNTCRNNCWDYYRSLGYSKKEASAYCDVQCLWVCAKQPI